MQRLKQGIIQGAGLGALVVCVGACLVTPIDNTTDTESESESEGDEDSTTEEDNTNTPSNPPTNPTEIDAETSLTSTGTTTPDPTDTETDTEPDTQGGVCGDSVVDRGEACDDGVNDGSYGGCAADCQSPGPMCGDNNVDDGDEVCDDGVNDGSYGGCAADCQAPGPFCGDGSLDDGEEACDDGNDIDEDECSNTCEPAICGDGIVQPGLGEVCDDEVNDGSYGGCAADCLSFGPFCGDGIIDEVEACDDTNMDSQDGCLGNCAIPQNCKQVHEFDDVAPDGVYMLSVDGTAWSAYCDMTTDGGGWTVFYASGGGDNEKQLVSNIEVGGNPLIFQPYNLSKQKKLALAFVSTESIYVRPLGIWLKANRPTFDVLNGTGLDVGLTIKNPITLTTSNGVVVPAFMGYSTISANITGGGDFGITQSPDAITCGMNMQMTGFDHQSTTMRMLNCTCLRQYLGSRSDEVLDNDPGYDAFLAVGSWTAPNTCAAAKAEGGLPIYMGMR
jgi:cysteine-rich repeat protein